MNQLLCADRDAKVRGPNVRATFEAFGLLPAVGRAILERHGIARDELIESSMVPVQNWLNAIADIRDLLGAEALRIVGRRVVQMADVPPAYNTAEKALLALDTIYQANHSGDVGHYRVTQPDADTIVVRCETPYPPEVEQGIVEGFANLRGKRSVELVPGDGITHSCTLIVRR